MFMSEYTIDKAALAAQKEYSFFDLMVSAGQMEPATQEKFDFAKVKSTLSKVKISRPRSLGGAVAAH